MFKPSKLTPDQSYKLDIARVAFMQECPFYAHLYYSIGEEVITTEITTACTDGKCIFINPDYFCKFTAKEQVFILAHEMAHLVMCHPQRLKHYQTLGSIKGKPVHPGFANICADYVINADLVDTGIGTINPSWLYDPQVKASEVWEDVYARLWKDPPPPPPGGGGEGQDDGGKSGGAPPQGGVPGKPPKTWRDTGKGPRGGKGDAEADARGGSFDEVLPPSVDPTTGEADLPEENEFKEAVARAAAVAKAMGKLPGSIQRIVDEILAPQVDWRDHIRMLMTSRIGHQAETWRRPNRRRLALNPMVVLPGRQGHGCELVVVGVDTSGSIGDKELASFLAEVGGVLADCKPKRIVVMGCDARVTGVEEVFTMEELGDVYRRGLGGGGGTSFVPVFDKVAEDNLKPDTLVYLTDMMGTFPSEAPAYPVIWAATTDIAAPWGEVVRIKVE